MSTLIEITREEFFQKLEEIHAKYPKNMPSGSCIVAMHDDEMCREVYDKYTIQPTTKNKTSETSDAE